MPEDEFEVISNNNTALKIDTKNSNQYTYLSYLISSNENAFKTMTVESEIPRYLTLTFSLYESKF